jgi:hypothetical protein
MPSLPMSRIDKKVAGGKKRTLRVGAPLPFIVGGVVIGANFATVPE